MGEYLLDWNETSIGLDSPNNAIPIPRNQHSQNFHRLDYNKQGYLFDTDSPNLSKIPTVPPNSLVMGMGNNQLGYPVDGQRTTLSPFNPNNACDLDMDIKIEPMEELLDIGSVQQHSEGIPPPEDNLLDNVNFEDLLMSDDMDASTTCLDPQHSSPAAMATVHPDEVLGFIRSEAAAPEFTPSMSLPVKSENASFGCLATSFPPQGIGWRDPPAPQVQGAPSLQSALYQTLTNSNPNQIRGGFCKETPVGSHPRLLLLQNEFSSSLPLRSEHSSPSPSSYINNNNELFYTQLETVPTNSALHDLLVSSPQHYPQQQLSPAPNSLSPASPHRGFPQEIPIGQSVPGAPSFLSASAASHLSSRLSSSAPVNNFSLDQIWQRREPRQHLLSTGSLAEEFGGSASSLSTGGGILSPMPHDLSIDEEADSEEDSDGEHDDSDSDNDSIMSEDLTSLGGPSGKKERHFWQYNVQAKGPKGHRVNITHDDADPHQLTKIMDPVFSPLCSIQGIKHSGKARRGDGNDLTPSPRKLVSIGVELGKLNKKINEMTPVSELPSAIRSKSRKEKNKLASRACRLKKKAQHEANKIKLYGLEQEHKGMLSLISKTKGQLIRKIDMVKTPNLQDGSPQQGGSPTEMFSEFGSPGATRTGLNEVQIQQIISGQIEKSAKMRTKPRIAGCTTEFVNKVIEHCRGGNPTGGLDELAQTFVNTLPHPNEPPGLNYNNELYT